MYALFLAMNDLPLIKVVLLHRPRGTHDLPRPVSRYRWIPKAYFRNYVKVIYGTKLCLDYGDHGIVVNNADVAEVERNQFNLLWQLLPKIEVESTAHERI